jgi:hypothetical protein
MPKKTSMTTHITNSFLTLALLAGVHQAAAQGTTAFTYQGQLQDGGLYANGAYTMIFKLYDSLSGGNQVGSAITNNPTLANGLFTASLDFGAGAFNGSARWLDITVSNGVAQTLSPRVPVLPAPYAQFAAVAATVTNGAIMNAQLAASAVNANNIASGQVVRSLNGLKDAVSLSAGNNVTLTTNGNGLQISAASGGVVVTNALAAGNNVGLFTNSGVVQISSFVPNIKVFGHTNATFVVPTNVTRIMVEMWGGGGGGGSGYNDGINQPYAGGGGGAGAYAFNVFTVTPGSSYSVSAPSGAAGGQDSSASSFDVLMSAGGGSAGVNATISGPGAGGVGGTATGSIMNVHGGDGQGGDQEGQGGGVWRGGSGIGGVSGPGSGGNGWGPSPPVSPGGGGNAGAVIVYY